MTTRPINEKKTFFFYFQVLEFEPNNVTAKEFYPLIQEKLKCKNIFYFTSKSDDFLSYPSHTQI